MTTSAELTGAYIKNNAKLIRPAQCAMSGAGHRATTVNNPAWVEGKFGSGLHFDGRNQWVDSGPDVVDTTGNYIVSAWVTMDKLPDLYTTVVSSDSMRGSSAFFLPYGKPIARFALSFSVGPRAVAQMVPEVGA